MLKLANPIIQNDLAEIYAHYPSKLDFLREKTIFISGAYGMLASYLAYFLIYLNEEHNFKLRLILQGA